MVLAKKKQQQKILQIHNQVFDEKEYNWMYNARHILPLVKNLIVYNCF